MLGFFLFKDKRGNAITNNFQKKLDKNNCNTYKIWVDKCSEQMLICLRKVEHYKI